ncbi:MAG TPA: hypothetical protein VH986_13430 [Acidimicrobiia bacterium]|jgi:hypothetical protein
MTTQYRVETFDAASLDDLGPDRGNEMEQRLNELACTGWKVVSLATDDDGYVVVLQHSRQTRQARKRTATQPSDA